MDLLYSILHAVELTCVALLLGWGVHRLVFLVRFLQLPGSGADAPPGSWPEGEQPHVAVQLPMYNERHVVERLIRAAGALRWPADRLTIQVLDDSDDETVVLAAAEVARLREAGIWAEHVRRGTRTGYKAGALAEGLARTDAQLIAVFDADFVPEPDFLERTAPHLAEPGIGMVQARWGHLNRDESLLTRAQGALLDGHFAIEHRVRAAHDLFFNFNGTAGVWRREAIEEAGGWQHDTLTEDLDLSYRSQLAGWRFRFLDDVVAPAELPAELAGFRQQQHRWAKGSAQTLRKLGGRIARADQPLRRKVEAFAHLSSSIGYPLILVVSLLLPISLADPNASDRPWHLALFLGTVGTTALFYERCLAASGRSLAQRALDVPLAIALGIGISLSQTRAVLEGVFGFESAFVRTPKRGWGHKPSGYLSHPIVPKGAELGFAVWILLAALAAGTHGRAAALPLVALLGLSFAWIGVTAAGEGSERSA